MAIVFGSLAMVSCMVSAGWAVWRWRRNIRDDARTYDDHVGDIRAMNTYNSYFLAGILVFLGLALERAAQAVPTTAIVLLLLAFTSASVSIFYVPLDRRAGHEPVNPRGRIIWLVKLIATNWTVIFSFLGVVRVAMGLIAPR